MANAVYLTGQVVLAGAVTTPASITTAIGLTMPTAFSSSPVNGASAGGELVAHVFLEGANAARFRFDGTPTTTVGHLISIPPTSGSIEIVIRGASKIAAFKIIGAASGSTISYYFEVEDDRR